MRRRGPGVLGGLQLSSRPQQGGLAPVATAPSHELRQDKPITLRVHANLTDAQVSALVAAVLAEQNDEWTESRLYMGLEILDACRKAARPDMWDCPIFGPVTQRDIRRRR